MSSLILVALLGCGPKLEGAQSGHSPAIPPLQAEGPVFYAPVVKARVPLPTDVQQNALPEALHAGTEPSQEMPDPLLDLDDYLRSEDADVAWLVAGFSEHQTAIQRALQRCLDDALSISGQHLCTCLHGMQLVDPALALQAASRLTEAAPPTNAMAKTMLQYPREGQLEQYLVDKGVLTLRRQSGQGAMSAGKLLRAHGKAQRKEYLAISDPGGHARLLQQWARLAEGELAEVVFDEFPPSAAAGWHHGYHTVYAWSDRIRFRILLEPGALLQQEQMVGFLNSILRDRGSDGRYAMAYDACSPPLVVVGTVAGFDLLQKEELMFFEVPTPEEPESSDTDQWNMLDFMDL